MALGINSETMDLALCLPPAAQLVISSLAIN